MVPRMLYSERPLCATNAVIPQTASLLQQTCDGFFEAVSTPKQEALRVRQKRITANATVEHAIPESQGGRPQRPDQLRGPAMDPTHPL